MAKFKPAGKKKKARGARSAVPCVIVIVAGIALFTMLFYAVLRSM
jgi:hypothetical protein